MRNLPAWAITVLGAVLAILGGTVMVVLGPDNRFVTGPHPIDTSGVAVVTAPGVVAWRGLQVDVLAEVPVNKPVFVGVGNSVDVEDYVAETARLEVTSFQTPWTAETREVDGENNLPGAPTALDWWIADQAGLGGAAISMVLPDETVSIAILSVGSSNLAGLEVTFAYGVRGGFGLGAGLLLLGLGGVWLGQLLRRGAVFRDDEELVGADHEVVEEEIYVWVDEDGVEHEISADELADFEIVEEDGVEHDTDDDTDVPVLDDPAQEERPRALSGIMTAGDIVAQQDAESEPEPEPARQESRTIYVWVDDDGVEHEIGEDELTAEELAEFEILEEDES